MPTSRSSSRSGRVRVAGFGSADSLIGPRSCAHVLGGTIRGERFETQYSLSGSLQQEDAPFVDLTDIETFPIDIAHDALDGRFVCGDEDAYEQFKQELETTFAEQRDTIRRQQRDVIDRIAEDGLRG